LDLSFENTLAGLEATGSFWENLYSFLTEAGYKVIVINPYQTNKFREALRKKAKTDDIDALVIAGLLRSGDTAASYVPEEEVQTLREITKMRYEFIKDRKNYQRQVYALLEVVFPEYSRTALGNPFAVGSTAIFKRFPTARHLAKARVKQIEKIVRSIQGNNLNIKEIKSLIEMARSSIYSGRAAEARGLTIKMLLENIQMLNNHITELEKQMEEILSPSSDDDMNSFPGANLLSIPGVGKKTLAAMLSAVGFEGGAFDSGIKLIGHIGFFPKIYESGETRRDNKISSRGPKCLRWALYMAAVACLKHNPEMRSLYHKKVSQGKTPKQALIIVAKKLAHLMLSMLKTGASYKPERVFVAP
ncbi:IS110 family transposase, partial [candidate division NPL-UPA2 bacterium]|nr:IS110 family transposase [candidate division NPL-UPA2 bacterium]